MWVKRKEGRKQNQEGRKDEGTNLAGEHDISFSTDKVRQVRTASKMVFLENKYSRNPAWTLYFK